jgi:hypothetical protein
VRPLPGRIEESFLRRVERLPEETRLLLVVAAAEPVGDPALVWRAAGRLGIPAQAAMPAAQALLLEFGARVRFRHPLVRSVVYRSASLSDLQKVHAALAEATDPEVDPDRRAWHRAQATVGPDEDVAAELERSADRAQARGGLAAAASLERSAELTLDPARRAQRVLTAAQAKHRAGAPDAALGLLAAAQAGSLDEVGRARVDQLRAQIAYSQDRGSEAPRLLLRAAKRLESLDAGLARETYLDALWAAQFAGRLARGGELLEVARAALAAPPAQPARTSDLLLDGLATAFVEGYVSGAPMLKQAVSAFRRRSMSSEEELRWLWLAGVVALNLWDDESFEILADRHIQLGRKTGALSVLPIAMSARITAHTFAGELLAAAELVEEVRTVTEAIGTRFPPYGPLTVAAWQGREAEVTKLIETTLREVTARGEGQGVATVHHARAVLYNGLGHYAEALVAAIATQLPEAEGLTISNLALPELIEAAARTGQAEQGTGALRRLSAMTRASGSDWALASRRARGRC